MGFTNGTSITYFCPAYLSLRTKEGLEVGLKSQYDFTSQTEFVIQIEYKQGLIKDLLFICLCKKPVYLRLWHDSHVAMKALTILIHYIFEYTRVFFFGV